MTRKPREHGWLDPNGNTHHIDTQRLRAFHSDTRKATCGVWLHEARRVRVDSVDCMTCIVRVAKRQRYVPRPAPGPHTHQAGGPRAATDTYDPRTTLGVRCAAPASVGRAVAGTRRTASPVVACQAACPGHRAYGTLTASGTRCPSTICCASNVRRAVSVSRRSASS